MAVTPTPMLTSLQVMQDAPVIPVIVLNDVAHAVPMARALVAGGIRMLEVTLRTPQALACIEAIARELNYSVDKNASSLRSQRANTIALLFFVPLGISFFTFQGISYLIDVYRRDIAAQSSFLRFAMYKAMFPQLIAGPIVRYSQIADEIDRDAARVELRLRIWLAVTLENRGIHIERAHVIS